jgi:cytochrome P450
MNAVPSSSGAVGNSPDWLQLLPNAVREHGDVVRFHRGWLFAHPDAVRDVLVTHDRQFTKSPALRRARFTLGNGLLTNEGETYRRQRALVQPSLHPKALAGYAEVMARHAADAAGQWRDHVAIDVHREMTRLTLRIVAEALFGTPIGPEVDAVSRAMDLNVAMFRRLISPWGWFKVLLPTPFTFRFLVGRRRLVGTLRRFIASRRAPGERRDDLLSRLLAARDAADGAGMTERQLLDECVTLFAAGHETTASALTFTLWLLARHPDVMRRLQAEVDAVLPDGRPPEIADVEALPYARAVVAEAMRLYPPAWIQGRQAKANVVVGDRTIRRGEVIFVSQWVTHRDARWWPNPERFDPERFAPERREDRPRWAYFPFGGGSRACVGEAFAWAEAIIAVAQVARRWNLTPADPGPLLLEPGITLRPAARVAVVPHRRSPAEPAHTTDSAESNPRPIGQLAY